LPVAIAFFEVFVSYNYEHFFEVVFKIQYYLIVTQVCAT